MKKLLIFAFVFSIIVYFFTSAGKTPFDYFTRLADSFLQGKYYLTQNPPWLSELIPAGENKYFVVYPPIPAILLIPFRFFLKDLFQQQYLAHILGAGIVILTMLISWTIKKDKSLAVWSGILIGLGSIIWFLSATGSSWYLGQVSSAFFLTAAIYEGLNKKRPSLIGLFLGAAFLSRLHTILSLPIFLYLLWGKNWLKRFVLLGLGLSPFILFNFYYNYIRFGVIWDKAYILIPGLLSEPWFQKGLFNLENIPNHLKILFTALPRFSSSFPFATPSWAGLAIWITTPAFVYSLLARMKEPIVKLSWISILLIALIVFSHGTTGFTQFGYRFAVDFYPILTFLTIKGVAKKALAWHHWLLLLIGVLVNLWGGAMDKQIRLGWLLIFILAFGFFVRTYKLSHVPPELFSDEITQVLSARSIIETGKDTNGKTNLFLYNKIKLGTPISGYLSALSTYLLGKTPFAVRLPVAIGGTISIFLIFEIAFILTKNKTASFVAAFFGAVSPWGIFFSRIGWEPGMTIPFLLALIYLFLKGSFLFYPIAAVSMYASDALEFLSPLFLITMLAINYKDVVQNLKKHILGFVFFVIILIPLFYVSLTQPLKNDRAEKISTFRTGLIIQNLSIFAGNYAAHFTPQFLFTKGDPNLRHGTGESGVLFWTFLPFILIGLYQIIKNIRNKNYLLIFIWLLYFPLGGSLTNDGVPHASRTLIGMPVFILIASTGVAKLNQIFRGRWKKGLMIAAIIVATTIEFYNFAKIYFIRYPINSQGWWEYGQSEVYKDLKEITNGNESMCLTNIDYWHEETLNNYYLGQGFKYKIIYDPNDPKCLRSQMLVLLSNYPAPPGYKLERIVKNLEGQPKWNIYKSLNSYTE